MDMTLVVMAAGLGSRYGGVKQIERLGPDGEILMEYAIYDALRAGFDRIVLIIKPQMLQDVRDLFGDRIEQRTGMRIDYAFQTPDRFTAARPELAVVTNIGDSRAYLISREGIRQISKDHSLVENMVDHGELTPQQARKHPSRNLITRALGPEAAVQADTFPVQWKQGDFLLLCSDGLVNTVTDQEILFEVIHGGALEECLQRLLALSRQRGAPDNVTAILLMNI